MSPEEVDRRLEDHERRLAGLERDVGSAPNDATGSTGTGAFRTIALAKVEQREMEIRLATYRGIVLGVAGAVPIVSGIVALARLLLGAR